VTGFSINGPGRVTKHETSSQPVAQAFVPAAPRFVSAFFAAPQSFPNAPILYAATHSRPAPSIPRPLVPSRGRQSPDPHAKATRTIEVPLEKYVAAALAGESSIFKSSEALKAMSIAARTYAVRLRGRHASEGFDSAHPPLSAPGLDAVTARLETAVDETSGELLWYQGKPAFTSYTRDCGGRTEDASAVWPELAEPYLKSHDDPYCTRAGSAPWRWTADPSELAGALNTSQLQAPARVERITIAERTASGRARTWFSQAEANRRAFSASSFRFAVGRELAGTPS